MRKFGKFIIIIALFLCMPKVKAEECSPVDRVNLSKIAQNVTVVSLFDENTATFKLVFSNVTPDVYIFDVSNRQYYYSTGIDITTQVYYPGSRYQFIFYSNAYGCDKQVVYSKYITLPDYNPLYKDENCKGLENHKICNKWSIVNMSYDEFKAQTQKLREKNEVEEKPQEYVKGMFDYIIEFILKYNYIMLPLALITLVGLIYAMWRKAKKEALF